MKLILFIFLFSLFTTFSYSQTVQIENLQKERLQLQEEIKNTNKLFLDVKKQTTTIVQRINLINKQINARKKLIEVQRNEIVALNNEQANLIVEIEKLNIELKKKQKGYEKAVTGMLKSMRSQNSLFFVLSGKNLSESLRRMQYLKDYSKWRKAQAEEIKKQNVLLNDKKNALSQAKIDKENALRTLQNEQQNLISEEKTRQVEMADVKGREKELQRSLKEKQQQASKLNSRIEQLITEEVARQEREAESRRRAEEAERKLAEAKRAEQIQKDKAKQDSKRTDKINEKRSTSKGTADKETIVKEESKEIVKESPKSQVLTASAETFNLNKSFVQNKGKLPMPVTGPSTIVNGFGVNKSREWNVTINNNGVDIQAQRGANIRSIFEGEVSRVFPFANSNTCMIIRHGEYYTFYANIVDPLVKQGDKVKTGQSLGKIFTDPDTGISNMHFQLWQKTTKLDPTPWLKK